MVSMASLFGARHLWEVVENKPASSLVVSLSKALNGKPPPLCGRQVAQTPRNWPAEGNGKPLRYRALKTSRTLFIKSPGVDIDVTDEKERSVIDSC